MVKQLYSNKNFKILKKESHQLRHWVSVREKCSNSSGQSLVEMGFLVERGSLVETGVQGALHGHYHLMLPDEEDLSLSCW